MKHFTLLAVLAFALTGCNAMTSIADGITNKKSSFSQQSNTIYPTVDGTKEGEPAPFGKAKYSIAPAEATYAEASYGEAVAPTSYDSGVSYGQ